MWDCAIYLPTHGVLFRATAPTASAGRDLLRAAEQALFRLEKPDGGTFTLSQVPKVT